MNTTKDPVHIYTDGASRGNPGPGGYGVMLIFGNAYREYSGGFRKTTNNRMELLALIIGLEKMKTKDHPIHIFSDSKYVVDAITKGWLDTWIKTNFKGDKKNPDLWKRYYALAKGFNISLHWVKGHADNPYNNRCDELATAAADQPNLPADTGYEGLGLI